VDVLFQLKHVQQPAESLLRMYAHPDAYADWLQIGLKAVTRYDRPHLELEILQVYKMLLRSNA
jgi:hypothetical protein